MFTRPPVSPICPIHRAHLALVQSGEQSRSMQLQREVSDLERQLWDRSSELEARDKQFSVQAATIQSHLYTIAELQKSAGGLLSSLNEQDLLLSEMRADLRDERDSLTAAEEDLASRNADLARAMLELSEAEGRLATLHQQRGDERTALSKELAEAQGAIERLQGAMAEAGAKHDSTVSERDALLAQRELLALKLETQQGALKFVTMELGISSQRLEEARAAVTDQEKALSKALDTIKELEAVRDGLLLKAAASDRGAAAAAAAAREAANEAVRAAVMQRDTLTQARIVELETLVSRQDSLMGQQARGREEMLKRYQEAEDRLLLTENRYQREIEALQAESEASRRAVKDLEAQLIAMEKVHDGMQAMQEQTEIQRAGLQLQLEDFQNQIREATAEFDAERNRLANTQAMEAIRSSLLASFALQKEEIEADNKRILEQANKVSANMLVN